MSRGPKIVDLPDDPTYGGNASDHPGEYYVPQLELGQVEDSWVTPQVFNNWESYFKTGYSDRYTMRLVPIIYLTKVQDPLIHVMENT